MITENEMQQDQAGFKKTRNPHLKLTCNEARISVSFPAKRNGFQVTISFAQKSKEPDKGSYYLEKSRASNSRPSPKKAV